ncbi:periplasmic or secreted lipoprotein [Candidatus Scalindua japonica]|uniref:Periplasmic or secreted lipoprotein n=1 Tax=Candidatus Scalindua japonica TaxID=1284222 RepID=A0A286TZE1_9BACT|nr:type II toxin-antitoxin system HicA family toxin [Candidatus Scalindua japonica]GAX61244.1 periplasmic or secreted lipoprotein [Candidatus Scalindua japonica]
MPRVNITSKEVEKVLKRYGFVFVGQKGSHQQFKTIIKGVKRRVTVLDNKKDFDIKTFQSMVRQSGFDEKIFFEKK